jgi:multimeric flavodoxin WrbA
MKKILGISFSPRKLGNSEIAIREIANNIPEDIELEVINIHKYNIKKCIACYSCLFEKGKCKLDDDFFIVFEKLINADAFIFAVPSYFLGPNSSFKTFIDRFLISYAYFEKLYQKPAILVTLAGVPNGGEGYTDLALKTTARILNLKVKGEAVLYGALPGEVVINEENKSILKQLGKNFFSEDKEEPIGNLRCNICGSNYFEFLDNNFVKCIVCKNKGKIICEGDKINVYIEEGDAFFGTREANLNHKKWLMSMKERFLKERRELLNLWEKFLLNL